MIFEYLQKFKIFPNPGFKHNLIQFKLLLNSNHSNSKHIENANRDTPLGGEIS
jgi:hypothetical protein